MFDVSNSEGKKGRREFVFDIAKICVGATIGFSFNYVYDLLLSKQENSATARSLAFEVDANVARLKQELGERDNDFAYIQQGKFVKKSLWQHYLRTIFEASQPRLRLLDEVTVRPLSDFYQDLTIIENIARFSNQLPETVSKEEEIQG